MILGVLEIGTPAVRDAILVDTGADLFRPDEFES